MMGNVRTATRAVSPAPGRRGTSVKHVSKVCLLLARVAALPSLSYSLEYQHCLGIGLHAPVIVNRMTRIDPMSLSI